MGQLEKTNLKKRQGKKEGPSMGPVQPTPVQFFYKKIQEEKKAKEENRETLEFEEKHSGLTKKEELNHQLEVGGG